MVVYSVSSPLMRHLPRYSCTGWLGLKHPYLLTLMRHLPWYSCTGWLGVKHQVTTTTTLHLLNWSDSTVHRGRFGIVRRCIQKCSGQELAAKLIARRMVRREAVEIEFNTLQSLQHPHLVQVYDLYETANANIIIMQLWVTAPPQASDEVWWLKTTLMRNWSFFPDHGPFFPDHFLSETFPIRCPSKDPPIFSDCRC